CPASACSGAAGNPPAPGPNGAGTELGVLRVSFFWVWVGLVWGSAFVWLGELVGCCGASG
ncbi:hypothetical protein HMPREF9005_2493, partial [Actinomyces sp. oral taxon 178 str. F0338]